ncbi:BPSL0761 family protein [Variovorax sp. PAMC 28711]|uniref:BPSL0761 family protein n=1 Tax=Variovorax sp. PAMC 28711 TaxID=1795631 RepID=UPI0012E7B5B1|nr:BPSL0761 family protein [Variovorax sp. PAMC 28711]
MTVPYERRRAIEWAGQALRDMRSETKDATLWGAAVPEKLRQLATQILRHYPTPEQIDAATGMDDVPVSGWIAGEPGDREKPTESDRDSHRG